MAGRLLLRPLVATGTAQSGKVWAATTAAAAMRRRWIAITAGLEPKASKEHWHLDIKRIKAKTRGISWNVTEFQVSEADQVEAAVSEAPGRALGAALVSERKGSR